MDRDGFTEEEALGRIGMQMADSEKLAHADYVIQNDGTFKELEEKVKNWADEHIGTDRKPGR